MDNTQEKDLNPYEFTIEIDGEPNAVRIEVPKTGDYIVYINGERLGHIYSEAEDAERKWKTKDDISQQLVDKLGAHIEILEINTAD
ncbi:hypothetical protein ACVWYN_002864 [Pedobacter sp. UYP24]